MSRIFKGVRALLVSPASLPSAAAKFSSPTVRFPDPLPVPENSKKTTEKEIASEQAVKQNGTDIKLQNLQNHKDEYVKNGASEKDTQPVANIHDDED